MIFQNSKESLVMLDFCNYYENKYVLPISKKPSYKERDDAMIPQTSFIMFSFYPFICFHCICDSMNA